MEINESQFFLNSPDGNKIEVRNYSTANSKEALAFAPGFTFSGARYGFIERLSQEFEVYSMSPRGSGNSTGNYTFENYAFDFSNLLKMIQEERGELPYCVGHSSGGHIIAKILGEEELAKRAVLLDPLIWMDEQTPFAIRFGAYLREKLGMPFYQRFIYDPKSSGSYYGEQKLSHTHLSGFLRSRRKGIVSKQLKSQTRVLVAGSDCYHRFKSTRRLLRDKLKWEAIGASVDIEPRFDHWFCGKAGKKPRDVNNFCNNRFIMDYLVNSLRVQDLEEVSVCQDPNIGL